MEKKRRLVISWDSYSWIHEVSGYISRCPKSFDVIILTDDSDRKIHWLDLLCRDAIYAQRKHDLREIGTSVGVKSLSNFLFYWDENEDIDDLTARLTAKLQMHIFISRPQEIYFQSNLFLDSFFNVISKKMDIDLFSFGDYSKSSSTVTLTDGEVYLKNCLLDKMVGLPHYQLEYSKKEYIHKIG